MSTSRVVSFEVGVVLTVLAATTLERVLGFAGLLGDALARAMEQRTGAAVEAGPRARARMPC